ncbi:MAG: prolipoprotein diacylglyceryl transferase [Verrucomicrobiales bacterium]
MLAYYVHDLSPFLIRFSESVGVRWYGLAYVLAFVFTFLMLRRFSARGYLAIKPDRVPDFVTFVAVFGVMLGGRLGHFLIYNREGFLSDPMSFFRIWQGGMASHGGIAGIVLFTAYYAWRHRLSWPGIGDNLVVPAPFGIGLGRLANFINGELYGRAWTGKWAMQFPMELFEDSPETDEKRLALMREFQCDGATLNGIVEQSRGGMTPEVHDAFAEVLTPRHPSQLYQALMEGFLLFALLYFLRVRFPRLGHGILTGVFFIGYAVARIIGEVFREPDSALVLGITKGQFYSALMIPVGAAFLIYGFTVGKKQAARQAAAQEPAR